MKGLYCRASSLLPLALAMTGLVAGCGSTPHTRSPSGGPSSLGTATRAVSGSLQLSGAIAEHVTASAQRPSASCHLASPPQLSEVDFGSGSSLVVLQFLGASGTNELPLPGNGLGPADVTVQNTSGAEWGAGQDFPESEGTLTLHQGSDGGVDGQVSATLEPVRNSTQTLKVTGQWQC